jgi:hypothetical protein
MYMYNEIPPHTSNFVVGQCSYLDTPSSIFGKLEILDTHHRQFSKQWDPTLSRELWKFDHPIQGNGPKIRTCKHFVKWLIACGQGPGSTGRVLSRELEIRA